MDNPTTRITNPHDKLFKETLGQVENARSFLQHYLAEDVLTWMDLDSLAISKDSFVEKELAEYFSDLVYTLKLTDGSSGVVYILFEHKSWYDKYVHLKLLEYMLKIWQLFLKQQPPRVRKQPLPIIIPMLICHGSEAWPPIRTRLASLFSGPVIQLARYIPDFSFELYDLRGFSDFQIKGVIMIQVVLLLFKYYTEPDFLDRLPGILILMRELMQRETGLQYLETVMRYLFSVIDDAPPEKIREIVEQAFSDREGDYIMTIAERLRHEGKIEGKIEGELLGRTKGKIETLEELYQQGTLSREQMEKLIQPLRQQLQKLQLAGEPQTA